MRKLFGKLKFNIEEFPKPNYYKGKKGTYGEVDVVINVDDPKVFSNGNKQFGSFSLPQTQEDRKNQVPRTYLDGWVLDLNSVGSDKAKTIREMRNGIKTINRIQYRIQYRTRGIYLSRK